MGNFPLCTEICGYLSSWVMILKLLKPWPFWEDHRDLWSPNLITITFQCMITSWKQMTRQKQNREIAENLLAATYIKHALTLVLFYGTVTHSSTLAWKIPWTEEPGRLQSMGLQRVGHDWATKLSFLSENSKSQDIHWLWKNSLYNLVVKFELRPQNLSFKLCEVLVSGGSWSASARFLFCCFTLSCLCCDLISHLWTIAV